MSGFTDEEIPPGMPFLAKPFFLRDVYRLAEEFLKESI